MSKGSLIGSWRRHLAEGTKGLHLVDAGHPLQILIGAADTGAPRLVVRSATKPMKPVLSSVVHVDRYEDKGAKWNLNFVLQDPKFEEVFLRLADDLCERSRNSPNEAAALDRVGVVLDEWRRLLKPRPSGLLTMEELRGLIGELTLLLGRFSKSRSIEAAVEGWLGPLGLPQDFWFEDEGYREAKSIGPSVTRIRISSEQQLDAENLELVVLRIANTAEETIGAVNLPTLILRVHTRLAESGAATEPFDARLSRLGVDLGEAFYEDTWFVVAGGDRYAVDGVFPRIIGSQLPASISRVSYQVDLDDIDAFKIDNGAQQWT